MEVSKQSPVKAGAEPHLVSRQFSFTEGPAADQSGNVFFTDQPNNRIWKWEPSGNLSLFLEPAGRSNGMFFSRSGALLSCADEANEIWSISPDKQVTVLLSSVGGKKLNGPNDLWEDAHGGIYFTDPYYQREYWSRKAAEIEGEHLYYLPKGAAQPVVVDSTLVKPNGIVGTPDGKYLYVADIRANKTYRYEIGGPGKLGNRKLFTEMGSDGMTLDRQGNVYLTGKGVTIFNAEGTQVGQVPIAENWTANVCFGGANRDLLFITASQAVYTLQMAVQGAW
jgi:gluconolactonase